MHLRAILSQQTLSLIDEEGAVARTWPLSSAAKGIGFKEGSFQTPTGRFLICEKIGAGEPPYTIFKNRRPTGLWDPTTGQPTGEDHILTRILWLKGLDPENANTRERYIYLHGTHQEETIGQPVSHGCLRLTNHDILEVFQAVEEGTLVEILAEA
ncbi:MAG: L,D-transpeptidase [Verrucomicrobiota bacterium]